MYIYTYMYIHIYVWMNYEDLTSRRLDIKDRRAKIIIQEGHVTFLGP